MPRFTHHHPCQRCGERIECDGVLERNHDGWPETICRSFHLSGGAVNPDFICEGCYAAVATDREAERTAL